MKLKKFKVRYCISPERCERIEEVLCSDADAAKNIVKYGAQQGSMQQRQVSIHDVVEIDG